MAFAPTFGSFGDFLTAIAVIRDVVKAVGDTHGSAAEYRSLAGELTLFHAILEKAYRLCEVHSTDPEVQSLHRLAKEAIDNCQMNMDAFKPLLHKYESSLGDDTGSFFKKVKQAPRKVLWLKEKPNIDKFLTELNCYNIMLNTTLSLVTE